MTRRVIKLGGATLRDLEVAQATLQSLDLTGDSILVVSAPGGMTDQILAGEWSQIRARLVRYANVFSLAQASNFVQAVDAWLQDCESLPEPQRVAQGELWSAELITALLRNNGRNAHAVDARSIIRVRDGQATVESTAELQLSESIPVVTGFIASGQDNETLTLGRDGSDFSAALIAEAVAANTVDFVTDTRGIRTADPRWVPGTKRLSSLSFAEARLVTKLGGGVLHERTIEPLERGGIAARVYAPGNPRLATHIGAELHSSLGTGLFLIGNSCVLPVPDADCAAVVADAVGGAVCTDEFTHVRYDGSDREDALRWLRTTHAALFEHCREVEVVLYGPGGVGREFIKQLHERQLALRARFGVGLKLRGIARRSGAVLFDASGYSRPAAPGELTQSDHPLIIVDTTASLDVALLHAHWLRVGHCVVTANKLGLAGDELWRSLLNENRYHASATVGAGLPMLEGCRQRRLETANEFRGVLSGSVNFILDRVSQGIPFDNALAEARTAGLVEPDPRTDLEGTDTARKAVILARALGLDTPPEHIAIESLDEERVTAALRSLAPGQQLAYVATLRNGRITIRLEVINQGSFLAVTGTGNVLEVLRNNERLLAIAGPGAGRRITAAAVLRDCIAAAIGIAHQSNAMAA